MSTTEFSNEGGELFALYREMLRIRLAEERLAALFADGAVPGFIHLSIGQEAVAVGLVSALHANDTVASNHRGHGHALAKGLDLSAFYLELFAKDEGLCRGRGGSMHVADFSKGMLGANGIVGAGMSIAVGSALAHKSLGKDHVAVVFFGDGALGEGLLHESINLAKILGLPVLFVCENNGWSEFSATSEQISFNLESLVAGYGLRYSCVEGNDVLKVANAAGKQIAETRAHSAPSVLECKTLRVRGHFEGDAQKYRTMDGAEVDDHDPLLVAARALRAEGVSAEDLADARRHVDIEIDQAVEDAKKGSAPSFADALVDVYAQQAGA